MRVVGIARLTAPGRSRLARETSAGRASQPTRGSDHLRAYPSRSLSHCARSCSAVPPSDDRSCLQYGSGSGGRPRRPWRRSCLGVELSTAVEIARAIEVRSCAVPGQRSRLAAICGGGRAVAACGSRCRSRSTAFARRSLDRSRRRSRGSVSAVAVTARCTACVERIGTGRRGRHRPPWRAHRCRDRVASRRSPRSACRTRVLPDSVLILGPGDRLWAASPVVEHAPHRLLESAPGNKDGQRLVPKHERL